MNNQPDLFGEASASATVAPSIEGMTYLSAFMTRTEENAVLQEIDRQPWRDDLKRRVQHYGYLYDYKARRIDPSMFLGPLPAFVMPLAQRLVERCVFDRLPDQLIVNEYLPGQGISAHVDCEPCFGGTIAMMSLGWTYEMDFIHTQTREIRTVLLERGSVLVIRGEARYDWLHQIKARRSDRGIPRQRRVSLTFRNVLLNSA